MDKERLLNIINDIASTVEGSGDRDAEQSALNIRRTVVICAAGMDEEFEAAVKPLFDRAVADELNEMGKAPANPEQN